MILFSLLKYFYIVPWAVPSFGWAELRATLGCIASGKISNGDRSLKFAELIRNYLGASYAIAVNRGRTAIELALRSLELKKGDEVIIPSYVCISAVEAIVRVGAEPVFADIGKDLNIDPDSVQRAISSKTKCIIVPHLFGKAARIDEIEKMAIEKNICLIDDAAQSFGATLNGRSVGSFGDFGIVGIGPGKSLAGPSGGVLVTNREELFLRASAIRLAFESCSSVLTRLVSFLLWRRLRRYTLPIKIALERVFGQMDARPADGLYMMSNLEAALGIEQLCLLTKNVDTRKENGGKMLRAIGELARYCISDFSRDSFFLKLVLVLPDGYPEADYIIETFKNNGIECQKGYMPCHNKYGVKALVPYTESIWRQVVWVPVDTMLKGSKISSVSWPHALN